MDEMEKYRNSIERRYGDRRKNKDRRSMPIHRIFDWFTVAIITVLTLVGIALSGE